MITTVTLNPAIDREFFVRSHKPGENRYIYNQDHVETNPGGKGLISAINLVNMGYDVVQNLGFIGGQQGLFFEKMVQDLGVTTNYVTTRNEIRNNIFVIGEDPVSYTQFNDYTYKVSKEDVQELLKRFERSIRDSELIIMAGSIPAGIDFDIYRRLIEIANRHDKRVYLRASGKALSLALPAEPFVVVPYFKHEQAIMREKIEDFDDAMRMGQKLVEAGAQYVIFPFECDILLFEENNNYSLYIHDFCLRNWLGAGDAYDSGFWDYCHRNGFDFVEANRYGAAAALTIAEEEPVYLHDRKTIEDNLERVTIL
ncbi:MAG: 1-phosphofructokinase family hexose kinase [bacterium]